MSPAHHLPWALTTLPAQSWAEWGYVSCLQDTAPLPADLEAVEHCLRLMGDLP